MTNPNDKRKWVGVGISFACAIIATLALGIQLGMAVQRALFGE